MLLTFGADARLEPRRRAGRRLNGAAIPVGHLRGAGRHRSSRGGWRKLLALSGT